MMQYTLIPGVQGICPTGWHLPTKNEYTTLINFLGGSDVAGGALKEAGEAHWNAPNTGATNSSGFTSLPAGEEEYGDQYVMLHTDNRLWTSTIIGGAAYMFQMSHDSAGTEFWDCGRSNGSSVRCLKN